MSTQQEVIKILQMAAEQNDQVGKYFKDISQVQNNITYGRNHSQMRNAGFEPLVNTVLANTQNVSSRNLQANISKLKGVRKNHMSVCDV